MLITAKLSLDSVVTDIYKTYCLHGSPDSPEGIAFRHVLDVQIAVAPILPSVLGISDFFFTGSKSARAWR
jgi:hypothetical protein